MKNIENKKTIMRTEDELERLLEEEIAKGNAILFNDENMRELLKDRPTIELKNMIKDLYKAYSVDDDLMRINTIIIIQKIIKEREK